jgi:hypothetical protein
MLRAVFLLCVLASAFCAGKATRAARGEQAEVLGAAGVSTRMPGIAELPCEVSHPQMGHESTLRKAH